MARAPPQLLLPHLLLISNFSQDLLLPLKEQRYDILLAHPPALHALNVSHLLYENPFQKTETPTEVTSEALFCLKKKNHYFPVTCQQDCHYC